MIDYFALLQEARRPWIDPEMLKAKFLSLSAEAHPDRVHGGTGAEKSTAQARYTDLNAAYNCLREPKERLRHLLELELGAKPREVQPIPPGVMDLFMEVSALFKAVDAFLAQKQTISSPLLQVQLFEQGQEWIEKLELLQKRIGSWLAELLSELRKLDMEWQARTPQNPASHSAAVQGIEKVYGLFSYLGRWLGQIQERKARISFG